MMSHLNYAPKQVSKSEKSKFEKIRYPDSFNPYVTILNNKM